MAEVDWNFACNGFGFDALESETFTITLLPVWEVPALYRIDPSDEFGFSEIRSPLAKGASIRFYSKDERKFRRSVLKYWRYEEISGEIDFPFCGILTLAEKWLNIEWNIPSVSLINLKSNLLAAAAFSLEPKISVSYRGNVVAGNLGIGGQPDIKEKWLKGNATLVMTGLPTVSIGWGDLPLTQNRRGYMEMWELLGT